MTATFLLLTVYGKGIHERGSGWKNYDRLTDPSSMHKETLNQEADHALKDGVSYSGMASTLFVRITDITSMAYEHQ